MTPHTRTRRPSDLHVVRHRTRRCRTSQTAPRNTRWRQTTPTRTTSDIPGPFRKTRDDVARHHAALTRTSHPLEESTIIKGPRMIDHPVTGIKSQPSYQKGGGKRH
ncbi:unnamed protein product [Musa acuminata var. zebrina]